MFREVTPSPLGFWVRGMERKWKLSCRVKGKRLKDRKEHKSHYVNIVREYIGAATYSSITPFALNNK